MPLISYLQQMDLDAPQQALLREVIVRSCLTPACFKLMTDDQLMAIGFPLPAILELKDLISLSSSPLVSVDRNTTPVSQSGLAQSATPTTPLVAPELEDLTAVTLRELASHISVKSNNGLKQLTRVIVDEMTKV